MGSSPGLPDQVKNGVTVVTPVCHDVAAWRQVAEELGGDALVVRLACGQDDADRQAVVVDDRVDFGA